MFLSFILGGGTGYTGQLGLGLGGGGGLAKPTGLSVGRQNVVGGGGLGFGTGLMSNAPSTAPPVGGGSQSFNLQMPPLGKRKK